MSDNVITMVPVPNERDEEIFAAWEGGKGMQALARQFGLSVVQIEQALDRMLPAFDAQNQLCAFKRELRRLEDLGAEFFAIAKRDKNHDSAHLYARLNERICAMRGIGPMSMRMDPLTVEVKQQPTRYERITEAIERLTGRPLNRGDGQQRLNGGSPPLDHDQDDDPDEPEPLIGG